MRNDAVRLSRSTRSKSASSTSCDLIFVLPVMPALLTSMSIRPRSCARPSTLRDTAASSLTSTATPRPRGPNSLPTSVSRLASRSNTTTNTPGRQPARDGEAKAGSPPYDGGLFGKHRGALIGFFWGGEEIQPDLDLRSGSTTAAMSFSPWPCVDSTLKFFQRRRGRAGSARPVCRLL